LLQNKLKSRPTYAPGSILAVREKPPVLQSGTALQKAILWRAENNRGMLTTGASAYALMFPLYAQECC